MPRKKYNKGNTIAKERDANALDHKTRFLLAYRKWSLKSRAADEAGVTVTTIARWLREDPAFKTQFDSLVEEVQQIRQEELEEAAYHRALIHSDQMAKFMLMALDPEKYRERFEAEHRGQIKVIVNENLSLEDL